MACTAIGTLMLPTEKPRPCWRSSVIAPPAASRPNTEPPESSTASIPATVISGSSRAVSRAPGPPPCVTAEATFAVSKTIAVTPVATRGSCAPRDARIVMGSTRHASPAAWFGPLRGKAAWGPPQSAEIGRLSQRVASHRRHRSGGGGEDGLAGTELRSDGRKCPSRGRSGTGAPASATGRAAPRLADHGGGAAGPASLTCSTCSRGRRCTLDLDPRFAAGGGCPQELPSPGR